MTFNKKLTLIVFIAFACLFYIDKIALGPYAPIRIHDSFHSEFIRYRALGELFLKYGFFAWFPHAFGGMPSYVYHFPPFYILCLLSTFMPSWLIYAILAIALMVIAGFGMYWFLKDFLNINPNLSFAGGILFSLYSQVQANAVVTIVFNYAFPAFFMCLSVSRSEKYTLKAKIVSFLLVLFIILISCPVVTLPFFCTLQFLIIFLLDSQTKESKRQMIIKTSLIWIGYVFFCLPVLYALYTYVPFSQRTYKPSFSGNLFSFLFLLKGNSFWHLFTAMKDSGIFLVLIGLFPLLYYSNKMRKAFLVFLIPLLLASFFASPSLPFLSQTIFEKMDMVHFCWVLPFASIVFVILGFQELLSKKFPKPLYIVCLLTAGFFYLYLVVRKGIVVNPINFTVPLSVYIIYLFKKNVNKKNSGIISYIKIPLFVLVVLLSLVVTGQFRLIRYNDEGYPYKRFFENNSIFTTLREKEGSIPFRIGTLSDMPMIVQNYGIETVDSRGPLQPKYYKEYFKEIIRSQLKTESHNDYFNRYWYQLYLRDPRYVQADDNKKNSAMFLNIPLLLMINTKYIVSNAYDSSLASVSEEVIKSECNNLVHPNFWDRIIRRFDSRFERRYCLPLFVYKLKDTFERGYLAKSAVILPSDTDVLNTLARQPIETLREKVFFSAQDPIDLEDFSKKQKILGKNSGDRSSISYYSPDRIIFDGFASSPSILVVTNNYHPNWSATVNGRKTKIYRANHTFQAIIINNVGKFNAVFEYRDPLLWKMHYFVPLGVVLIFLSFLYKFPAKKI